MNYELMNDECPNEIGKKLKCQNCKKLQIYIERWFIPFLKIFKAGRATRTFIERISQGIK